MTRIGITGGGLALGHGGVRLGGGGWIEGVSGLSFTTTSTNAAWTPTTVTKSGGTLTWQVLSSTGALLLSSVANKPTFNLSALAGTKTLRVTSPDGWAGLSDLDVNTLALTGMNLDVADSLALLFAYGNALLAYNQPASRLALSATHLSNTQSNISGTLASMSASTLWLFLENTPSTITGALSDLPETATNLILGNTQCDISGGGVIATAGITEISLYSTGRTQAQVDEIVGAIYANRTVFNATAHTLNIGGTNAAPSGIYQASATPTTGKEQIYALVNDPNAEGFNLWTITYTA